MFWTGSRTAIQRAERMAAGNVVGLPEYLDGAEVPDDERVTERWDVPRQDIHGRWVIRAHPDLTPSGVELVARIDWPNPDPMEV